MSRADDRTLILLRHAKTEQVPGKPDHDRQLTERGERDAQAFGRWLQDQALVPELVICSTSLRTRKTWEHAVRGGAHTESVEYRRQVYLGGSGAVLQSIREDGGDSTTLLVVGHSPSVPDLAGLLSDGQGAPAALAALGEGFGTCTAAVLRYAGRWADLDAGLATLERVHAYRG